MGAQKWVTQRIRKNGTVVVARSSGPTPGATATFLVSRGLWLMVLETTWVSTAWTFRLDPIHWGVLWAIGGSMVLLGALSWLPRPVVGAIGVAVTLALNAVPVPGDLPVLGFLCQPQGFDALGHHVGQSYAIVPWFGVMACGYGLADLVTRRDRHHLLVPLGLSLVVAFAVLRSLNGFGDPAPWAPHDRGVWITACAFLNPSKYPPSLMFQLMTLGPVLAAIPLLNRWRGRGADAVRVFGRVPLFFYLVHLPLIHAMELVVAHARYGTEKIPAEIPLSFPLIAGSLFLLLALLWPLCRAWDGLKARRRWWWLSYL